MRYADRLATTDVISIEVTIYTKEFRLIIDIIRVGANKDYIYSSEKK